MTPEMVHYGSVPESTITEEIENVRRILNSEQTGSHDAETLRSLVRVCSNAMKQYRRSRPDASRQGIRRAKAILEGKKDVTGKRVGGGMIPSHPILRGVEMEKITNRYDRQGKGTIEKSKEQLQEKLKELKERDNFLRAMSNFRPKETIFESFATAGAKAGGVVSHLDKGRTTGSKKNDSSAAYNAMKNMRRQMKLAHDKGTSLVVAGSDTALTLNGEASEYIEQENTEHLNSDDTCIINGAKEKSSPKALSQPTALPDRRRLSKAERKRLKKAGNRSTAESQLVSEGIADKKVKQKQKQGTDFRDPTFYIDNDIDNTNTEESRRSRHIEAAMQPSASAGKDDMASALRLEEAMLDIVGDENNDLVQRQRMVRWDKSKRKYIQTTLGQELSGDSKSKKLRLESGQLVNKDKAKLGELYEKWQKKNNKSIGRSGVFDDEDTNINDSRERTSGRAKKSSKTKAGQGQESDLGLKSESDIKKKRANDKKLKLKNMKKSDRSRLETKKRQNRNQKAEKASSSGKGWQGKKGFSGRY
jgi:ATP-dependent RNA helicase DDX54/DBP10